MKTPTKERDYKGKLLRLFREIMILYNSPNGYTVKELAEKVGISWRTVYRDIQLLSDAGFFTEETEPGRFAIRGLDREVRKFEKNLQFSPPEAAMLSQAVGSIPANNPLRKTIMEKLLSFSGMDQMLKTMVNADISRSFELLAKAQREKKQVILVNYSSSNSQSIRNRRVEPYQFSTDGTFLKAFETDSNTNKTFKMERIQEVLLTPDDWKNEKRHEKTQEGDIFGFTGQSAYAVKLRLSLRAANLLKEEFPRSRPFIVKEDAKHFLFEAEVRNFAGVGRFILGLLDEIEVQKPEKLREWLEKKIGDSRIRKG